jgi:hypothetical protein
LVNRLKKYRFAIAKILHCTQFRFAASTLPPGTPNIDHVALSRQHNVGPCCEAAALYKCQLVCKIPRRFQAGGAFAICMLGWLEVSEKPQ